MKRCPHCGHVTGYTMEAHPDVPGLLDWLRGVNGEAARWTMAGILFVMTVLVVVATRSVF